MSDGTVSLNDIIQTAIQAEASGVPVDWKELTFKTYNVATNYITQLEQNLQEKDANTPSEG